MKLYDKLMESHNAPLKHWSIYTDVECLKCGKNQALTMYRTNNDKCIKCGNEIKL